MLAESNFSFPVQKANQQFLSPFLLKKDKIETFVQTLLADNFIFFDIEDETQEEAFYGNTKISHEGLDTYFMPNIEPTLFPKSSDAREGIRRFSKAFNQTCSFHSKHLDLDFEIDSIDVIICPFHIGLINIRITLPENLTNNDVATFGDLFSSLIPVDDYHDIHLTYGEQQFTEVKELIFNELMKKFKGFIDENMPEETSHFGSLPFYKDERMYVMTFLQHEKEDSISEVDLFRTSQLNGYNEDGSEYVGATNPDYMKRFYQNHAYDRWAENTYYMITDYHFTCLTGEKETQSNHLQRLVYGEHFYTLLLIFFYKLVLLKLSHDYSKVKFEKDQSEVEILTMMINEFSSKYYLPELNSRQMGKEMAHLIQTIFEIEKLYDEVSYTLETLFQSQDQLDSKKINAVLQILTMYTVISGIFGMNLVIESLTGSINWNDFTSFSLFEWLAVVVTVTGILLSFAMGYFFIKQWLQEKKVKSRRLY